MQHNKTRTDSQICKQRCQMLAENLVQTGGALEQSSRSTSYCCRSNGSVCIQVQLPRGLSLQLDGTHQKPETGEAEAVSPGDRWKREPVSGLAIELREDELSQGGVGSLSKAMESGKSKHRKVSDSELCLQAFLGCGDSRMSGTVEWKELWRLSKMEKKERHS